MGGAQQAGYEVHPPMQLHESAEGVGCAVVGGLVGGGTVRGCSQPMYTTPTSSVSGQLNESSLIH